MLAKAAAAAVQRVGPVIGVGGLAAVRSQPDRLEEDLEASSVSARRGVVTVSLGLHLGSDCGPSSGVVGIVHKVHGPIAGPDGDVVAEAARLVECPPQTIGLGGVEVDQPVLVDNGQTIVHDQLVGAQRRCPVHRIRRVAPPPGSHAVDLTAVVAARRCDRTLCGRGGRLHFQQRAVSARGDVQRIDLDRLGALPPDQTGGARDVHGHRQRRQHAWRLDADGDAVGVRRRAGCVRCLGDTHDRAVGRAERDPAALDRTGGRGAIDRDQHGELIADRDDLGCERRPSVDRARRPPAGRDLEDHRDQRRGQHEDHRGGAGQAGDRGAGQPGTEQRARSGRPPGQANACGVAGRPMSRPVGRHHQITGIRSSAGRSRRDSRRRVLVRPRRSRAYPPLDGRVPARRRARCHPA